MTRRVLLTCCVAGCLAAAPFETSRPVSAQQAQEPGRARLQNAAPPQGKTQPQGRVPQQPAAGQAPAGQAPNGAAARQQRPNTELRIPKELDELLIIWEQQSSKITRLRGQIFRYKYDSVYSVETRAAGAFWYESPDMGRIDFSPGDLTKPSDMKGLNDTPFVVQADGKQKWICTGKQVFIIDDDKHLFDKIDIPAQQQGKNIINGPLPFLFGLKAEQAKQRYYLSLGAMHWPQGRKVKLKDGTEQTFAPQVHVVAVPKLEVDKREWSRAEVLLDGKTFIPTAIKLFNPQGTMETVYKLPPRGMKVNEAIWVNNPFNDRPPAGYTLGFDSRAANEETEPAPKK
jgi:TIGR03009 family protein